MKVRGFEIAKGWEKRGINLPKRATQHSAGYDIEAAEDTVVPAFKPGIKPTMIATGLKAYCAPDEYFSVINRSSGASKGLVLANGIGIIDADYYNNTENDGHFRVLVFNVADHEITVKKGERIAQVIFQKYLIADNDIAVGKRSGGFGSTDEILCWHSPQRSTDRSKIEQQALLGRLCQRFAAQEQEQPLVVYDIDDVTWLLEKAIADDLGIDLDRFLSTFSVRDNAALTSEEREKIIAAFGNAKYFENIQFMPGVENVLAPEELGAKVMFNSNAFSERIGELKKEQILAAVPGLKPEQVQINIISYGTTHKKELNPATTILVDDSPFNIALSPALINVMPAWMPWSYSSEALTQMVDKPVAWRDTLDEINDFVYQTVAKLLAK